MINILAWLGLVVGVGICIAVLVYIVLARTDTEAIDRGTFTYLILAGGIILSSELARYLLL